MLDKVKEAHVQFPDCVGKTVRIVDKCWDGVYVSFTDGTFAALEASDDYGDISIKDMPRGDVSLHSVSILGIISQEEVEIYKKDQKRQIEEALTQRDLKTLAELKEKYEQPSGN